MKFGAYRVTPSGKPLHEVFADCNRQVFLGHGPDYAARGQPGIVVDVFSEYDRLLQFLASIPGLTVVPFAEGIASRPRQDEIRCLIRHDLDVDIVAALRMAELERTYGFRTSYYVLHTAPYYGLFQGGRFHRNECVGHVFNNLQHLGHEVGLHTDGLLVYQDKQIDGADAIRTELEWLRSCGLRITGTLAHNSFGVYGAENYAVFKGRPQRASDDPGQCPQSVCHQGKHALLQVLDEAKLGLDYEGNEVFWQSHTPVRYAAMRGANRWRWVDDSSRAPSERLQSQEGFVDAETLFDNIAQVKSREYLVLVVHPVYYGLRHSPESGPTQVWTKENATRVVAGPRYEPEQIHGCPDAQGRAASIVWANELGMIDKPLAWKTRADVRAIIMGSDNISAAHLAEELHCHSVAEKTFCAEQAGKKLGMVKIGHPGAGMTRLLSQYENIARDVQPALAVISLSNREAEYSMLNHWTAREGWSEQHLPADALHVDKDQVVVREASPIASLMRKMPSSSPQATASWLDPTGDGFEYCMKCLEFVVGRVQAGNVVPIVLLEHSDLPSDAIERRLAGTGARVIRADVEQEVWSVRDHRRVGQRLGKLLAELTASPSLSNAA